jgi:hypothetical protein
MEIKIKLPNCFVPQEMDFRIYCAVKLYKGKYINEEEAIKICGYSGVNAKKIFENNCIYFEKRYKKISGRPYTDWEYEEDSDDR